MITLQPKLYNSLTQTLDVITDDNINIYTCGPTVYSHIHIGNLRSFLTADLIVRLYKVLGYKVNWTSNITDVGHLTNEDLDSGQDKVIKALNDQGSLFKTAQDVANYYTESVLEDWAAFNLLEPDYRPKATNHIQDMIELIGILLNNNYAYITNKGVYFNSSNNEFIGCLSKNNKELLQSSNRHLVFDKDKLNDSDFALWKIDCNALVRWDSPWGWGYPGWHIECSAMSNFYNNEGLSIHTGGEDNKFPHHEAEIAQTKYGYNYDLAKCWVHTSHILVDSKKMSKSLGNVITLKNKAYSPMAIKLALLTAKYRKQLNINKELLDASQRLMDRYNNVYSNSLQLDNSDLIEYNLNQIYQNILNYLCNDLNTPLVLAELHKGMLLVENNKVKSDWWFSNIELLLGLKFESKVYSKYIQDLINRRDLARSNKNYILADAIRNELLSYGLIIKDEKQ